MVFESKNLGGFNAACISMASTNARIKFFDAIKNCSDARLWKVYNQDFELWKRLCFSVILRHLDKDRPDMRIGGYYMEMMNLRVRLLEEEYELLRTGARCKWDVDKHPIDWSIEDADLLRPWHTMRLMWTVQPQDKRQKDTLWRMSNKIEYTYLTESGFNHKN